MVVDPAPLAEYRKKLKEITTLKELEDLEQELFGRKKGVMTLAMKKLQDLKPEEKKEAAKELNELKKTFQEELEELRKKLSEPSGSLLKKSDAIDISLNLPERERGHLHLIPEFIRSVEEVFGRMGFDTESGPEIEPEEYNFDLLNIPGDHPARDSQDTFWIRSSKKGKDRPVLRTHTSPVQIRYMQNHKPPFRMICPGRVYRKDADATHSPVFHQFEGLMIGKDVSLANMKAILIAAFKELVSPEMVFRFRTGYFPFVEPGLEMDMKWLGDVTQSREGVWLEMGGCGMVHPKVLENVGIDPKEWQGFAFGFGIERPLMIKHQIPDIRSFFEGDVRFLRQF